jgi:hypothetical protein
MRPLLLLCLCIFPAILIAQKAFVRVQIGQGNTLVGLLESEDERSIQLTELNLGAMQLLKSQILVREDLSKSIRVEILLHDNRAIICDLQTLSLSEVRAENSELGSLVISRANVKSIRYFPLIDAGHTHVQFENPHPTRYFFGPSAIPLRKGERYYQNAYVLSNSIQYGLSDHFSIGGGAVIPFAFFITPKLGWKVGPKWHLGTGLLAASSFIQGVNFGVAVAYGSATYGTKEHNVTLNAGWGAVKQQDQNLVYNWRGARRPMFSISAMTRIANRMMLVTENWLFTLREYNFQNETYGMQNQAIFTGGLRFMGEKNSFDFGLVVPSSQAVVIPYIDYVIKF